MDVGFELRHARERAGITLQQISRTTKISLRVLQAIEASDESRLPAPVFTRSFVKTYAAEVGLEPDEIARRFLEQFAPPQVPEVVEPPRETVGRVLGGALLDRFGTAAVLFLVALAAFMLALWNSRHPASPDTPPAAAAVVSAAGTAPAATSQAAPVGTSGTARAPAATLHLAIAPTGPCWVQATLADKPVFRRLMNRGDRQEIDAPSDVTLRVGDPAACAFSINGAPARIPGAPGQAVTVHLTKGNYQTFLKR